MALWLRVDPSLFQICFFFFQRLQSLYLTSFYLFLVALGLCCCAQAFFSCSKQGLLSSFGARASHCGGFSCCSTRALGCLDFSGCHMGCHMAHGLSSWGFWALEGGLSSCGALAELLRGMWDLPRQGINPCPLHWQEDSYPLYHQGSPYSWFLRAEGERKVSPILAEVLATDPQSFTRVEKSPSQSSLGGSNNTRGETIPWGIFYPTLALWVIVTMNGTREAHVKVVGPWRDPAQ